jgi:hypothetical protein
MVMSGSHSERNGPVGEERFAEGERIGLVDQFEGRAPRALASGRVHSERRLPRFARRGAPSLDTGIIHSIDSMRLA